MTCDFFPHISENSNQDTATTYMHVSSFLKELLDQRMIKQESTTLWEETDGCAKQYSCATAMYLLSLISVRFNIVIDRTVGAPDHGKDIVDGLNSADKAFFKKGYVL